MATTKPRPQYMTEQPDAPLNWDAFDTFIGGLKPPEPAPPPTSVARRVLGDGGLSALKGAVAIPEAIVGLADLVTGGHAGKLAESAGFRPKEARAILDEHYSDAQKAANLKVQQADGFGETLTAAIENPSTIGHAVVESAPSLLPAGAIARGVMKVAPKLGGVGAVAIGEGAVSAGQTAEQVRQQTSDGLLTAGQSALAVGSGSLNALLTGLAGRVANRLGVGDIAQLVAGVRQAGPAAQKGLTRAIAEGMAVEGVLQELPQSAQEQIAQNLALGKPWDEDVGAAAAMGALTGGLIGGAVGPFNRGGPAGAADALRATKLPETGPLTKGTNASIEAQATAAEGAPAPEPLPQFGFQTAEKAQGFAAGLGLQLEPVQKADGSWSFYDLDGEPLPGGPAGSLRTAPAGTADDGKAAEQAAERVAAIKEELSKPVTMSLMRTEFGAEGTRDLLQVLAVIEAGRLPPRTASLMLDGAERRMFALRTSVVPEAEPTPQLAAPPAVPQLEMVAQPPTLQIGADMTPTGVVRVDSEGVAAPETVPQAAEAALAQAADAPTGVLLADQEGTVAPEAVGDAEVRAAELAQRAELGLTPDVERASMRAAMGNLAQPDDLTAAGGMPFRNRRSAQAAAARAGQGLEVVEISPNNFVGRLPAQEAHATDAPAVPSAPEQAAPAQAAPAAPGEVWAGDGGPWKSEGAAKRAAKLKPGYAVEPVDGGWVLRKQSDVAIDEQGIDGAAAEVDVKPEKVEKAGEATSDAPSKPEVRRVIGRLGRTPNAASPVHLRANSDGSLTPMLEGAELLYFDSGEPINLPSDVTDEVAKQLIRKAGAVSSRQNFFPSRAGDEALLSRAPDAASSGVKAADLQKELHAVVGGWTNGPSAVHIVQGVADLPANISERLRALNAEGNARALFLPKSRVVYLIADNVRSTEEAQFALLHEVYGHLGLRSLLGSKYADTMIEIRKANADLAQEAEQWMTANGADEISARTGRGMDRGSARREVALLAVEEALADRAGKNEQIKAWQRFASMLQRKLRRIGLDKVANWLEKRTQAEVLKLLDDAKKAVMGAGVEKAAEKPAGRLDEPEQPALSRAAEVPDWVAAGPKHLQTAAAKVDTYRPKVPLKEKLAGLSEKWQTRLVQGIADSFAPLKDLDYDAYVAARLSKTGDGVLEGMLLHGIPKMDGEGAITGELDGKGFLGALKELGGEHDRFLLWLAGNRAEGLAKEGRENLFTANEIDAMKQLSTGLMADGKPRADAYRKAAQTFQAYNNAVLDIAEKSGLIDGEARKLWQSDFYVPFHRLNEDETTAGPSKIKGLVRQKGIQKLKGGKEPLGDLLENTLRNWSNLISGSLANNAARKSLIAAEKAGVALETKDEAAKDIAKSLGKKGSATYFMDQGLQRWFVVDDPFVLDAITAMEPVGMGAAMKVAGAFKRWLTIGITSSPAFKVRNLIRDSISSIAQSNLDFNVAKNLKEGWKATDKNSEAYAQMLFSGALMRFGTGYEGNQAAAAKRLIKSGVKSSTILDSKAKLLAALDTAIDRYQEFGDRTENINRAALFQKLIAEGKTPQQAAFEARDLMDFGLQGAWPAVRFLAQTVPFLNARIQGLYKLGRAAKQDPRRMGYVVGATALASIALMLAYQDDDDWKAREDYDRDAYWWFKLGDTAFRIPKPFEIGAMGTIAERTVELLIDDEMNGKRYADRLRAMVTDTFAMNPIPQAVRPLVELWANKEMFTGRDIESQGMERHSKGERYDANTSMVARTLGKATGEVGISPAQIDAMVKGYLGWLGTFAVSAADRLGDAFGVFPSQLPSLRLDDVSGGFLKELPATHTRYATDFWNEYRAVNEVMADIKRARDIGDFEAAREMEEGNADKLAAAPIYRQADTQMRLLNKQIRVVRESPSLSGEEKREALSRLTQMRNDLALGARSRRLQVQDQEEDQSEE